MEVNAFGSATTLVWMVLLFCMIQLNHGIMNGFAMESDLFQGICFAILSRI